jgi:hypothetical protein
MRSVCFVLVIDTIRFIAGILSILVIKKSNISSKIRWECSSFAGNRKTCYAIRMKKKIAILAAAGI